MKYLLGVIVGIFAIMLIMFGFAAGADMVNLQNTQNALAYLTAQGYTVYGESLDTLTVTGNTTVQGSLIAKTGRTATYVIAASNAPQNEKDQADYIVSGTASDEIQAVLTLVEANNGGHIVLSTGNFTLADTTLTYSADNLIFEGQGNATIIDATAVSDNVIQVHGAITATNSVLTANANEGQCVVQITDSSAFSADDWIRIRSDAWFNGGTDTHLAELQQIESIASNNLTTVIPLLDTYDTGDTATVDLLTMRQGITLRNFKMIGAGSSKNQIAIDIAQVEDLRLHNITLLDLWYMGFYLKDVVNTDITGNFIQGTNRASNGYGIALYNSARNVNIHGNHFVENRHSITTAADFTYGVSRDTTVNNNTFNGGLITTVSHIYTHAVSERFVVSNNSMVGDIGVAIESPYTTVANNEIYTPPDKDGIRVQTNAHHVKIIGNTIGHGEYGVSLQHEGISDLVIADNTFFITSSTTNTYHIYLTRGASRVSITGNQLNGASQSMWLRFVLGSANSTDFVIADNIMTGSAGHAIRLGDQTNVAGRITNMIITGNYLEAGGTGAGIYMQDEDNGSDYFEDVIISNNIMTGGSYGAYFYDRAENIQLINNRIKNTGVPYGWALNAATPKIGVLMGNDWRGCSTNGTASGNITLRRTANIDTAGTWFTLGDSPN